MQRKSYLCLFCGKPAPFGIGYGGRSEDIPLNRQGYMWVCSEHQKNAIERRDLARLEDDPFYQRKLRFLDEQDAG